MGLFRKLKASLRDDWCSVCQCQMKESRRQLYMLPMIVGNYCSHKDVDYYRRNLRKVSRKAEIPPGVYACGAIEYQCPQCGRRPVKLSIFLPVRDQEKQEEAFLYENGELDDFLWK